MFYKSLLAVAVFMTICMPINSWAHQKDDKATITLDEFISRIQRDTKNQTWKLKGKDDFPHVAIEIKYNFGVLLRKSIDDNDPILVTILLDSPFRNSRPRTFPTTNGKTTKVDDFKIFFNPQNGRIHRNDFPAALKQFEKFLKNHDEPMLFKAHATIWSTSRYIHEKNHFYYLDIHFEELTPEPDDNNIDANTNGKSDK